MLHEEYTNFKGWLSVYQRLDESV